MHKQAIPSSSISKQARIWAPSIRPFLAPIFILSLFLAGCGKGTAALDPTTGSEDASFQATSSMTSLPIPDQTAHVITTSTQRPQEADFASDEPATSTPRWTAAPPHTRTPAPSATPTFDLRESCDPFPSDINLGPWGFWIVRCGDRVEAIPGEGDSHGAWLFYDYTPRTGRLAYGIGLKENESDYFYADIELWVYDYWTKTSSRWLPGDFSNAQWRPLQYDPLGAQPLAVLRSDGNLVLVTGPNQVYPWAYVGEIRNLTWSPRGDKIAYIKDHAAYVLALGRDQPRKLAENINGNMVWAAEGEALILQAQHMMVLWLDDLETYVLKTSDGNIPAPAVQSFDEAENPNLPSGQLLWSSENLRLVFSQGIWQCLGCDTVWVYELSPDLRTILTSYSEGCMTDLGCALYCWRIPGKIVETNSDDFPIIPASEALTFRAKVIHYEPEDQILRIGGQSMDQGGSLITPVDFLLLNKHTILATRNGEVIPLSDFSPSEGTKLEVTCRPIFLQSCVASKIEVFDE